MLTAYIIMHKAYFSSHFGFSHFLGNLWITFILNQCFVDFLPKVWIMTSSYLKFTIQLSINYLPLSPCPFRTSYHTLSGKILEFSTDITSNHSLLNSEKMVFNFNCGQSAIYTVKTNIYQLTSHIQAGSWKGRRNNSLNVLFHFNCYQLIPVPCFQCLLSFLIRILVM